MEPPVSNIPLARRILNHAVDNHFNDAGKLCSYIEDALDLMTRRSPKFVSPRRIRPLSETQKQKARDMRASGTPMNDIARALGTNLGRVSEACSRS
jgi:hypothetical protein